MRRLLRTTTAIALLAVAGSQVGAETALTGKLVGVWAGQGQLRARPEAAMERGACRLTAEGRGAQSVVVTGRCAGAAKSASITIRFRLSGDRLVADFTSSATEPAHASFVGRATADAAHLSTQAPLTVEGRSFTARVAVSFDGSDRFKMVQEVTDVATDASTIVFDMTFVRR